MNTTIRMRSIPFEAPQGKQFEEVVTVRRIIAVAGMLMMLSLVALGASTAQGAPRGWINSLDAGISQSKTTGKPLMLIIAREGCSACEQMEAELSKSINSRALNSAVKVRVESSYHPDLTSRFAAAGTPTTVIFASGNYNTPVYTYTGAMDGGTIRHLGSSLSSMSRSR